MKSRCQNPNHSAFRYYGARGIRVCDRWQTFEAFVEDVGERPSSGHTLDRINNAGDYEPDNVRWATAKEQANNQRSNRRITIDGVERTLSQWCSHFGRSRKTFYERLHRGMSEAEALMRPAMKKNGEPLHAI